MRKYKYTKETLDAALEELQSGNVVQRKKCVKFISMASRSELFGKTCYTLSVQTWFLSPDNREKLILVLHQETEEKLLWEYLLILFSVCERYIDQRAGWKLTVLPKWSCCMKHFIRQGFRRMNWRKYFTKMHKEY